MTLCDYCSSGSQVEWCDSCNRFMCKSSLGILKNCYIFFLITLTSWKIQQCYILVLKTTVEVKGYLILLINLEPNVAQHYIRRAECEIHMMQRADCISDLKKAIEINPNAKSQILNYDAFTSVKDDLK